MVCAEAILHVWVWRSTWDPLEVSTVTALYLPYPQRTKASSSSHVLSEGQHIVRKMELLRLLSLKNRMFPRLLLSYIVYTLRQVSEALPMGQWREPLS